MLTVLVQLAEKGVRMSALRLSTVLSRQVANRILLNGSPATTATLVHKKSFNASPITQRRIRGPEEEHEKIDDIHHWMNERYVAVSLLPIIPAALAFPNIWTDNLVVSAMVLHTYWRLSGVAEDYIHGEVLPKIAQPAVKIFTIIALGGLFYFNYNDIGFCEAVRQLYTQL